MKRERGFALLLVFVMAAAIAITLYNELPRVAFEAQRNKEQLLIDRGEQYTRAIQLYVRKNKTYPSTIEQLEGANQIRYLRKRYVDPMTGKSEWRLVHIGAGGVYIDSLVHKPAAKQEEKSVNTFTYEAPTVGSTLPTTGQADPAFPQARPSERVGMPMPGQMQAPQPGDPANPQQNAQPQPGASPFPGIPPGVAIPPGAFNPGANPAQPGQPFQPGLPIQPGQPFPTGQPPTAGPGPNTGAPPIPLFPQTSPPPDPAGAAGQNQALNMINDMLRNPRPVAQTGAIQPQGQQIGGGIAGVASTVEQSGIKIYNEMEKYNEWEFFYDFTKEMAAGAQQQRPGQPAQPGQPTLPGQPGPPQPRR